MNLFIATSSLFIAADVPRGTVGAQLKPVPSHCDGDYITDLRLLELVDKDVVVVLAVYSRGHLRAFDTNGRLLFAKRFADEPIHTVRIRSRNVQDGLFSGQPEDLSLFYGPGVVVLVTALALFSTICTRMHLLDQGKSIGDEEPTIPHRKWRLTGCGSILDAAVLGIRCSEVLQINANALHVADRLSSAPTITTDIVTVGANPAVALFDATVESSFASAFSVAQVAAAKLTSAVVGYARRWWSSTPAAPAATDAATTAAAKERIEPANSVAMRCGLFDEPRRVHRIALSVTGHLAATCDSLGRVALLDVQHLAMVKLWKGYRDAQLQWLLSANADAQFLLLHAPRRSQIEVWRTRHSSKPVATERIGRALLVRRNGAHFGAANRHGMSHQYAMMLRANGTIVLVGIGAKTN